MSHFQKSLWMLSIASIALTTPWASYAIDLLLPSNAEIIERTERSGAITLPTGQYGQIKRPNELIRGEIKRQSWQISGATTASALISQLSVQFQRQGFELVYQCQTMDCGGYDFRYGIETSPPPKFKVNLNAFDYVDMRRGNEIITFLASATNEQIYLQYSYIQQFVESPVELESQFNDPVPRTNQNERKVLKSAQFAPGATHLESYEHDEFASIAKRLRNHPSETCYIVGHSDYSGGLDVNMRVSLARAESVREILISNFDVDPKKIFAQGIAFLAPIASNKGKNGQKQNRRVEAVFLTGQ